MQGLLPARRRSSRSRGWLRFAISVLLLLSFSGGHWWMLQSVAWSRMLVTYSAESGLIEGIQQTFDGDHPCKMCVAIKQSRDSESGQAATLAPTQKSAELLGLPPDIDVLLDRSCLPAPTSPLFVPSFVRSPPLLPPPRTILA